MNNLKIGIVVADGDEYAPLAREIENHDYEEYNLLTRKGHKFTVSGEKDSAEVISINCGIGKVNAAVATMHLVDNGCNVILNYGLSGGISGIARGELCLGTSFLEHDFDLTGIGYKPCEKPGQKYIYESNVVLRELFLKVVADAKCGTCVTGDSFICDEAVRDRLKENFSAMSCDMETAAIAYVCDTAEIPLMVLRRISDDAGADAYENYNEMNISDETVLSDYILLFIKALIDSGFGN